MKKTFLYLFVITFFATLLFAQNPVNFDDYFENHTMRIDYFHIGDAQKETITIDQIYRQGEWAGNPDRLIDYFNNGYYYIKIYDVASNKLIYSRGYSTIFGEYQTTDPALNGIQKSFHETVLIPYPKRKILMMLEARDEHNVLRPIFTREIDPGSVHIIREKLGEEVVVIEAEKNGNPHQKADIVIVAEGYTAQEEKKFREDLERYINVFFEIEPYRKYRDSFNIYGLFKQSAESGMDEPRKKVYKNTAVNSSFNALNLERYLLTDDNKSLRDIAAHAPYDALIILVNSERYGGGGIHNFYAMTTTDNKRSEFVFHHEFGHSFAGLADEYYSSSVAYNDFYPKGIEPTDPNITRLLDPSHPKWAQFLAPDISIPTDWNKSIYDSFNVELGKLRKEMNKKIKNLKEQNADAEKIQNVKNKLDSLSGQLQKQIKSFILEHPLKDKVGVYEGAGYSSEDIYRPQVSCMMFSDDRMEFCKVCEAAIVRTIKFYSE